MAPLILNIGTRWRQAGRFTSLPLYTGEGSPGIILSRLTLITARTEITRPEYCISVLEAKR